MGFFVVLDLPLTNVSGIIICACGRGETGRRAVFRRQFFGVRVRIPSTAPHYQLKVDTKCTHQEK